MITNEICKECKGKCCKGCKYFNKVIGCTQEYNERSPSCKIYPFVYTKTNMLALDVSCPGWKIFGEMEKEAYKIIKDLEAG